MDLRPERCRQESLHQDVDVPAQSVCLTLSERFPGSSITDHVGDAVPAGLSLYGPLLRLALYYRYVQGQSALLTGLLLAPHGLGSLLPRTIAGRLTDRIGPRLVVVSGLVLTALGTLAFTQAGPTTSEWVLAGSLFTRGAGLAGATIAVMAGVFQGIPRDEVPDASSTTRIVQRVGGSFGSAALAMILATQLLSHRAVSAVMRGQAFDTAFWWAIGCSVLALLPALLLATVGTQQRRNSTRHSPANAAT